MHNSRSYPLSRLILSPVNIRPEADDVGDLIASIRAHGLLQPLVGRARVDDGVEIIDGGRRLRALQAIAEAGGDIGDIPVMLREEDDGAAYEASLAANIVRRALHPVTEFEAFVTLAESGRSVDDIATHFGATPRVVNQRLALGRLHPDVRQAWRDGRINGEAARAFTVASPDQQAAYLAQAHSDWQLDEDEIRTALTQEAVPAGAASAKFIGADAYAAAGGAFVPDLFVDPPDFADGALLERLCAQKLAAEAERIRLEEGWGEVLHGPAARDIYQLDRIPTPDFPPGAAPPEVSEIEARIEEIDALRGEIESSRVKMQASGKPGAQERLAKLAREDNVLLAERRELGERLTSNPIVRLKWLATPLEMRAGAKALVDMDNDGDLVVRRGLVTRSTSRAPAPPVRHVTKAPDAGDDAQPEPVAMPVAVFEALLKTSTVAAAQSLARIPRLARAAFVASQVTRGAPLRLYSRGLAKAGDLPFATHAREIVFEAALKHCLAAPPEILEAWEAIVIANSLDFTSAPIRRGDVSSDVSSDAVQALRCALPANALRDALVEAFDAEAHFKIAPKAESLAAIAECGDDPGKYASKKKSDLAAIATRLAREQAWLPALLRGGSLAATAPQTVAPHDDDVVVETAAQATRRIWRDEERAKLDALTPAQLRGLARERGVEIAKGAPKPAIIEALLNAAEVQNEQDDDASDDADGDGE